MKLYILFFILLGFTCSARLFSEMRVLAGPNVTNATNYTSFNLSDENEMLFVITNYFPELFFTNKNGNVGHTYVSFKTKSGQFIGCDQLGNLTLADNEITHKNLFIVVFNNFSGRFALRSWFGGYLGYDNTFKCLERKVGNKTDFMIETDDNVKKLNLGIKNYNETIAFKFNNGYFGVENNTAVLLPSLKANAILYSPFKGEQLKNSTLKDYYFEIARSK